MRQALGNRIAANDAGWFGFVRGNGLGAECGDAGSDEESAGSAEEDIAEKVVVDGDGFGKYQSDEREEGEKTVEPDGFDDAVGGVFTTDKVGHSGIITRWMPGWQKGWILFFGWGRGFGGLGVAPMVGLQGRDTGPGGIVGGAAGLATEGVAQPNDGLGQDEERPVDGIKVRRSDAQDEEDHHKREEGKVEKVRWARGKAGTEGADLLIAPAGGGDAVSQAGNCKQGQTDAEDNRCQECHGPKGSESAMWMEKAGGVLWKSEQKTDCGE